MALPTGYAAEILAAGNTLQVTLPDKVAPCAYDLDPNGTPKLTLSVTTGSYNGGTTYGTKARSVVATAVRRKVHPNGASLEESQSGSDVIVQFMLSEKVYSGDTVTLTAATGWATDSAGGGGEAADTWSGESITNNSTKAFQPPVAAWNTPLKKNYWDGTGTYTVSLCAFSLHPYDGEFVSSVTFTLTDGTNTVVKDVTASTVSSSYTREETLGVRVVEYTADFSEGEIGSINDGQCHIDATVRAGLGNVLAESNPGAGSAPNGLERFELWLDAGGVRPPVYVVVDPGSAGAAPAVHTTRAAAVADADGAYATLDAALVGIRTHNSSNHSYNGSGNGHIIIKDGTYTSGSILSSPAADVDAQSVWLTIEPESASGVTLTTTADDFTVWQPSWIKFSGLLWTTTGNEAAIYKNNPAAGKAQGIWMDGCTVTNSGTLSALFFYNMGLLFVTDSHLTGIQCAGVNTEDYMLARASKFDACGQYTFRHSYGVYLDEGTYTPDLADDNTSLAFFRAHDVPVGNALFNVDTASDVALVQGVFESESGTQALLGVGQNHSADMENVIVAYLSTNGQRFNYGYNNGSTDRARIDWALLFNIISTINIKDEVDAAQSGSSGDAFDPLYSVNSIGNVFSRGYSDPANAFVFVGMNSELFSSGSPADITYADDQSLHGGGGGEGDYSLTDAGDAANRVPAGRSGLSWDLAGNARLDDGTGCAGAYDIAAAATETIPGYGAQIGIQLTL